MNTSASKHTRCISHFKPLHTEVHDIFPPLAACIVIWVMVVKLFCSLWANEEFRKLWVLPESTRMWRTCFPTFPVTFMVWNPIVPSKAFSEIWGISSPVGHPSSNCSSPLISSSSSIILREYNLLFLHLWPGKNLSSHQKHNPFNLRSSSSWFFIDLVGLLEVWLKEFEHCYFSNM